jgi:hypothetical protein
MLKIYRSLKYLLVSETECLKVLKSIYIKVNVGLVTCFPDNTSNNLRVADFMLDLLVISSGGIYN